LLVLIEDAKGLVLLFSLATSEYPIFEKFPKIIAEVTDTIITTLVIVKRTNTEKIYDIE
jgi:hypothetical protein